MRELWYVRRGRACVGAPTVGALAFACALAAPLAAGADALNDEEPPPAPAAALPTKAAAAVVPALAVTATEPVGAATIALSPETMATQPPPPGFVWSVLRDVVVDEVADTYLYVKSSKTAQSTRAVPIPKDRKLLASCVAGGEVDDLQRGAVITVKFDSKGVVKPEIVLQQKVEVEVLERVRVLDRGGNKLYVTDAQGRGRGFAIEGGAAAWNEVVAGGDADDLVVGAKVTVRFDPSGREPLRVTILERAAGSARADDKGGRDAGCGCAVRGGAAAASGVDGGAFGFAGLALMAVLARRRRQRGAMA